RGDLRTDGPGLVRAVDAVERRAEIHGARAERIVGAADHVARQIRTALEHLVGRRPIRPLPLLRDVMHARPGEAGPADADAVAHRAPVALHQIEEAIAGIDDDGARPLAAVVADFLLEVARVHHRAAGVVGRFHHARPDIAGRGWILPIARRRLAARLVAAPGRTAVRKLDGAARAFASRP